ncbi:CRISPR-associated protein Cas5 [Klebsiella pneumoniae subsp. pneumoniae]|nr:CRISPR-associated protein Cas5 [Klebsiella pneumoniae subsp. pneumoniae]
MRQTTQYMLLWLEGPLQSWGSDSKFGVRDTLNFPDSLGHSGADLLCTRRRGPEVEWLAEMNNLPMEVRAYARTDKEGQPRPARADIVRFPDGWQRI